MKLASLQCLQGSPIFYPIGGQKNLLQHDSLKFAKVRVFGTDRLCPKKAELGEFGPIVVQKHIFWPPDRTKNFPTLRRSRLHF